MTPAGILEDVEGYEKKLRAWLKRELTRGESYSIFVNTLRSRLGLEPCFRLGKDNAGKSRGRRKASARH